MLIVEVFFFNFLWNLEKLFFLVFKKNPNRQICSFDFSVIKKKVEFLVTCMAK